MQSQPLPPGVQEGLGLRPATVSPARSTRPIPQSAVPTPQSAVRTPEPVIPVRRVVDPARRVVDPARQCRQTPPRPAARLRIECAVLVPAAHLIAVRSQPLFPIPAPYRLQEGAPLPIAARRRPCAGLPAPSGVRPLPACAVALRVPAAPSARASCSFSSSISNRSVASRSCAASSASVIRFISGLDALCRHGRLVMEGNPVCPRSSFARIPGAVPLRAAGRFCRYAAGSNVDAKPGVVPGAARTSGCAH